MSRKAARARKRTVWRAVVEALVAEDVEMIFGLPGNPVKARRLRGGGG